MTSADRSPTTADDDLSGEENGPRTAALLLNTMPSWLVSFFLHVLLIVTLAVIVLTNEQKPPISFEASDVRGEQLESLDVNLDGLELDAPNLSEESMDVAEEPRPELAVPELATMTTAVDDMAALTSSFDPGPVTSGSKGGEFSGRSEASRAEMARKYGGTPESEQAVDLALEWLAAHQNENGSWNFDHTLGGGNRSRKDPGTYSNAINAATGMALLPFLGAGHTQHVGKYRDNVRKGLDYLRQQGEITENGLKFWQPQGEMYGHGLAAIAICEAYAMTNEGSLRDLAEQAIRYIEFAQDPSGGGWRYDPREPGDTSVVGWQVMALKSAKMGGIEVNEKTWKGVKKFLDSVSRDYGAYYGYMDRPGDNLGMNKCRTAIGLLCRMYMGWPRDHQGLTRGVVWLSEYGPSTGTRTNPNGANMYYNYYATQVLKQYGGDMWKKWNDEMRDFLVQTQDAEGAERGSWYFNRSDDMSPDAGGRLYCTCMAAMTLEVYYRFLPLYEQKAVEDDFPLD